MNSIGLYFAKTTSLLSSWFAIGKSADCAVSLPRRVLNLESDCV